MPWAAFLYCYRKTTGCEEPAVKAAVVVGFTQRFAALERTVAVK